MQTAAVNDIRISYEDRGGGADVVLFVHGHPFDHSMWRPQLEALDGSGWRAVAPDLRGYGQTTVTPGPTTLDVFARDLMGLLDALDAASAVLVGLSMGGQIVMECARLFPSRVRGLVLAATFPRAETADGRVARYVMADRLEREGMAGYAAEVLPSMLAPQTITAATAVAAHVHGMMRHAPPAGAAAALRGRAVRPDYAPTLARYRGPSLVVVGDADSFTTRADADQMHALLADSELVWLHGVGHMPNLEDVPAFNGALRRLLERCGAPPMADSPSASLATGRNP